MRLLLFIFNYIFIYFLCLIFFINYENNTFSLVCFVFMMSTLTVSAHHAYSCFYDFRIRGIDIPEVDLVVQCEPPKDVESYIHRSGRTGRAGRTGTCICFYKTTQEQQLRGVERRAGIRFRRIGPPQPADIIKASARDATRFLDEIPPDVLQHFHDAAKVSTATHEMFAVLQATKLKQKKKRNYFP